MYQHILVPLDGSHCAEQALQHAVELARIYHSAIHLLFVMPVLQGHKAAVIKLYPLYIDCRAMQGQTGRHVEQEMLSYLDMMAWDLEEKGISVVTSVLMGDPAEIILAYISAHNIDLIVLAAHGMGGSKLWPHGGTAHKVLQLAPVPVLLIRGVVEAEVPSLEVSQQERVM